MAPPASLSAARPERRRPPTRHLLVAAATLMAVLGATLGCSADPEGPSPEDAAGVVVSGFSLGAEARTCLEERFSQDRSATVALGIGGGASSDQRRELQTVLEACIPPDLLGEVVATSVAAGVPGTTPAQEACISDAVLDLDEDRQGLLLVGLALSGDGSPDELDIELGTVTTDLFETCEVSLIPSALPEDTSENTAIEADPSALSTP